MTGKIDRVYSIARPRDTHTRVASCEEVDCQAHRGGWETLVNESTPLGQRQAHYIRTRAGRGFTERLDAGVTTFTFPPGQQCFAEHRVQLDRQDLYLVGQNGHRRQHTGPDSWLNEFGENLDQLNRTING